MPDDPITFLNTLEQGNNPIPAPTQSNSNTLNHSQFSLTHANESVHQGTTHFDGENKEHKK